MSNRTFVVGLLSLALLGACSGAPPIEKAPDLHADPTSGADPAVGQVSQALIAPPQGGDMISGVFRQSKWGKSFQTVTLVPDTTFYASNGTLATMGNNGYTLVDIDVDTSTGTRLYSAVFEAGVPSTQYWELGPSDFANKVSALNSSGWRLISLHTYVSTSGTLFYSGVFQPGPDPQLFPGAMPWSTFTSTIDSNKAQGYFLTNLAVYVSGGTEQYLGVWRYHPESTSKSNFWVSEWNSFAKQDELERAQGMRLVTMAHWTFNGDRKYAGVWLEGNDGFSLVAATTPSVYQRKVGELASAGQVPIRINIEHGYQPPAGLAAAFNDEFDPEVVGYSYGVSEEGTMTAQGAFGYARAPWEASNNNPGEAMTSSTRMDIASVTKTVATTAIFKLLEGSSRTCLSGTCNKTNFALDTPITSLLTGFTFGQYVNQVTVRMLVNMTSNLYEGSCDSTYSTNESGYNTCVLANCTKAWPQSASEACSPPSGSFNYNGADPGMLRAIVEQLTGLTFEQYAHTYLFVPNGINYSTLSATDVSNANCNPDFTTNQIPLYYGSGAARTSTTGIVEANNRARSLKVCGGGAMQMAGWQLDLWARALMTGVDGNAPILTTADRDTMLSAGMFGGFGSYPKMGQIFAKNGGFNMDGTRGMVSGITLARDINTQISGIVNTQGTDSATTLFPNMPAALVNGLVRMTSTPQGEFYITNRNSGMCLNIYNGAVTDSNSDGTNVNIIQWPCGSPVANNMLFVKRDVAETAPSGYPYFILQPVNSGHCVNDWGGGALNQWDCNGTTAQLYTFVPTSGGYGHIVNANTGNCLDVSGASVKQGTNIVDSSCSSAAEQDFLFQSNVPPDSGSAYGTPELFWPNDNGVTGAQGDWAYGSAKGQCAPGQPVTGLSESLDHTRVESLLCETYPGNSTTYPQTSCRAVPWSVGLNPPFNYTPNWPSNVPDWDPWYWKADCNANEYVAGVAQNLSGQVDSILCCTGNVAASSCEDSTNAEVFYNGGSHSQTGIDWDYGYYKGQCPAGEYVAGVSAVIAGNPNGKGELAGAAHALRCCSP